MSGTPSELARPEKLNDREGQVGNGPISVEISLRRSSRDRSLVYAESICPGGLVSHPPVHSAQAENPQKTAAAARPWPL